MGMDEKKGKILVVEDEESLSEAIGLNLELEGYEPVFARNGNEALNKFQQRKFDLIILDVMLPYTDGYTVCQQIRARNDKTPIIFLTAKNSDRDRVKGLKMGGDDYLGKPFDLEELLLRVKKLIDLHGGKQEEKHLDQFHFDNNTVDFLQYELRGVNGTKSMTRKELMVFKLLIDKQDQVVSREEILDTVWGMDVYPSSRTIDNFIMGFRKYIEIDPKAPQYIHSIRGVGYKFTLGEKK